MPNLDQQKRADCFVKQYGQYAAVGDVKLNGKLTLSENIADNGAATDACGPPGG